MWSHGPWRPTAHNSPTAPSPSEKQIPPADRRAQRPVSWPLGFHTMTPLSPHCLMTFNEKTPREEKTSDSLGGREGEKSDIFGLLGKEGSWEEGSWEEACGFSASKHRFSERALASWKNAGVFQFRVVCALYIGVLWCRHFLWRRTWRGIRVRENEV